MNNIILMGPPGAGKTTVAKFLSLHYNMPMFDIDDDHLEVIWPVSVGEKLSELGDDLFIQAEGEAMLSLKKDNTIISLTGSNPLHEKAMEHIKKLGVLVYLDVDKNMIMKRLGQMKVNRIVGMNNKTMSEILDYRKSFYEKYYDVRVMFSKDGDKEHKKDKVVKALSLIQKYKSTRGYYYENDNFMSVIKQGIAPDGGLFFPQELPFFDNLDLETILGCSYKERAVRIIEKFPILPLNPQELKLMIYEAYSENNFDDSRIFPIKSIGNNQYLLELFHGPTGAFKDAALQLTPKFFSKSISNIDKSSYLILVATSGDTGIAAIEGYKNEPGVCVMVLYPEKGVSPVQKMQMLSAEGDNVFVLGVDGDFDFCQSTVKKIFNDKELNNELFDEFNIKLNSANSINWGRLLPQVVYHVSSYLDLVKDGIIKIGDEIDVCVPSGNFGNLLAAYIAGSVGVPIKRYICASNENNVLTDFINTGIYDLRERVLIKTDSPSIDILKASNIERLIYLLSDYDSSHVLSCMKNLEEKRYFEVNDKVKQKLKKCFLSGFCSNKESLETIKNTLKQNGILIDTHTAVAKNIADKFQQNRPIIISSTAHWAKFPYAILNALGGDSNGKTIDDVYLEILNIAPNEKIHSKLKGITSNKILHNKVCPANLDDIVRNMKNFLTNYYKCNKK